MAKNDDDQAYIYTRSAREAREHGSDMRKFMSKLQGLGYGAGYMDYDESAGDGGGGPVVWYRYPGKQAD